MTPGGISVEARGLRVPDFRADVGVSNADVATLAARETEEASSDEILHDLTYHSLSSLLASHAIPHSITQWRTTTVLN